MIATTPLKFTSTLLGKNVVTADHTIHVKLLLQFFLNEPFIYYYGSRSIYCHLPVSTRLLKIILLLNYCIIKIHSGLYPRKLLFGYSSSIFMEWLCYWVDKKLKTPIYIYNMIVLGKLFTFPSMSFK